MSALRILLIRTSSLGDVVHALPVLTALRRNLPSARIGWLVERTYEPLLADHPDLDVVLPVELRTWRRRPLAARTWREMGRFLGALERFAPEVVLDLMGNHKAGVLAALTLADRRIGLRRPFRREPASAIWITEGVDPRGAHSVDRMLSLLDALEIPPQPVEFGGEKLPAETPVDSADVVIHPGAGWANKRYPPERWGEVIRLLHRRLELRIGVLAGLGEEPLAHETVRASGDAADVVRAPSLRQLVGLLRSASLVLGGDSGPVHLAHALGRPVVCLMGPTAPETNGPYGQPSAAVWRRLPCSFCHKRYPQTMPCLEQLSPDEVAERARLVLHGLPVRLATSRAEDRPGCPIFH